MLTHFFEMKQIDPLFQQKLYKKEDQLEMRCVDAVLPIN